MYTQDTHDTIRMAMQAILSTYVRKRKSQRYYKRRKSHIFISLCSHRFQRSCAGSVGETLVVVSCYAREMLGSNATQRSIN